MSNRLTRDEARSKIAKRLSPLGKLLRAIGAVRIHDDGDGLGCVFRWWHPVAWLLWVAMLPVCGVVGERISEAVPFRVSQWFRDHPERLQWL